MSAPRRIVAVLGAVLMLGGSPTAAFAQDDPTGVPPLSPTAPSTSTTASPPPPPPPPPPARTTPQQTSGLPNTGSDPRVLALLGAALLLAGVGLRLRAPDGRF
ncbi:MAG TPA: LPXTG cell wall anchor domain-containing protein [Solirubrobacteraceae bacterium]